MCVALALMPQSAWSCVGPQAPQQDPGCWTDRAHLGVGRLVPEAYGYGQLTMA